MDKKISEKASTPGGDGPYEGSERNFRRSGPKMEEEKIPSLSPSQSFFSVIEWAK